MKPTVPGESSHGTSVNLLHGCEPLNLQNESRRGGTRCHGLPNHLVRLEEERWRDREAQGLRGPEVDDELKLCGLLHREISRLGAIEDFVHVVGCAPPPPLRFSREYVDSAIGPQDHHLKLAIWAWPRKNLRRIRDRGRDTRGRQT
jgi:hypothetical protein